MLTAAALRADLHDAFVFAGGVPELLPLMDSLCERLLDVDVLAGLGGENAHAGVPVIGRRDHHGIDVFVLENAFEFLDIVGLAALGLSDLAADLAEDLFVEIAEGFDAGAGLNSGECDLASPVATADEGEGDAFVGAAGSGIQVEKCAGSQRGVQETSTVGHSAPIISDTLNSMVRQVSSCYTFANALPMGTGARCHSDRPAKRG